MFIILSQVCSSDFQDSVVFVEDCSGAYSSFDQGAVTVYLILRGAVRFLREFKRDVFGRCDSGGEGWDMEGVSASRGDAFGVHGFELC